MTHCKFLLGLVAPALLLAACAAPVSRTYTLRPASETATRSTASAPEQLIAVRATAPEALDRAGWVIRRGERDVQVLEQDRWVQPLPAELADALAQRLDRALGKRNGSNWTVLPQEAGTRWDQRIDVRVLRFDAWTAPAARVDDEFLWTIECAPSSPAGSRVLARGRSAYQTPLQAADSAGLARIAAEHARAVDELARAIEGAWPTAERNPCSAR